MDQTFLRTNKPSLGLNPSPRVEDRPVYKTERPLNRFQKIIQQAKYSGLNLGERFTIGDSSEQCCRGDCFGSMVFIGLVLVISFTAIVMFLKPSKKSSS